MRVGCSHKKAPWCRLEGNPLPGMRLRFLMWMLHVAKLETPSLETIDLMVMRWKQLNKRYQKGQLIKVWGAFVLLGLLIGYNAATSQGGLNHILLLMEEKRLDHSQLQNLSYGQIHRFRSMASKVIIKYKQMVTSVLTGYFRTKAVY